MKDTVCSKKIIYKKGRYSLQFTMKELIITRQIEYDNKSSQKIVIIVKAVAMIA